MRTVAAKPTTLGDLIKNYRQRNKISLAKLQELVGIDKSSLSRIENGEVKRPDFKIIQSIAAVLDIPSDEVIELYIDIGHKSDVTYSFLQKALVARSNESLITKIASKFLEAPNEDSLDLIEKLYQAIGAVEETSIQLSLYSLIIDYSRAHGIMPYIAKGLYKKYIIERNDFSKLNETYQLGKYTLVYANFLSNQEQINLYYCLGIHAYSLMCMNDSKQYMQFIIENDDIAEGEFKAHAFFSLCNSSYYAGEYENCKTYLAEYSKYSFPYIEDNVKFMTACLKGKSGNLDVAISQLESYLKDASEYNIVFAVTELLDLYIRKSDFHSAKMLLNYEKQMVKSLQDKRTTPFKRAKFAYFYVLASRLFQNEDKEKAFGYYTQSILEYAQIGLADSFIRISTDFYGYVR